jgi:hypothetical protein
VPFRQAAHRFLVAAAIRARPAARITRFFAVAGAGAGPAAIIGARLRVAYRRFTETTYHVVAGAPTGMAQPAAVALAEIGSPSGYKAAL